MLLSLSFIIFTLVRFTIEQSILDGIVKTIDEGEAQLSREPRDEPNIYSEYDFIIVGAGTAGCVVANRLSENPKWNILLIEAGGHENYLMDIPIFAHYFQFTGANWKYKTVPSNRSCLGMDNQQCKWPRGKVMGGSSTLNYLIHTRGNRRDYDEWAKMGNQGWSFVEVLPYFKKMENFTVPDSPHPEYHDSNGYLDVSYSPHQTKGARAFLEASQQLGLNYVDYNGPNQVGASRLQVNLRDGVRESSSTAYLHPIKERPNLHVKKEALVSKILVEQKTKQTLGVEFHKAGRRYVVRAKKEVVVSAGAINSPQLLMLSGIGPRKHLSQVGIPVLANLKVGYNLMDHIAVGGLTHLVKNSDSITIENLISVEHMRQYLNYHKGPFTIAGACEALVFHDTKNPRNPEAYPDVELLFVSGSINSDRTVRESLGITADIYDTVYEPIHNFDSFMVLPILMHPKSRGRVLLKSSNHKSKPLIFPNYLAYDEDVDTVIRGVHLLLNITKQPALRALEVKLHDISIPQCSNFQINTDDYFKCMLHSLTFTMYHQSGTCKMGPASDKRAVVDPRLRVYKVKGLRVVDASVMPTIPTGHTNAPTVMIAEKAADIIKEDWRNKDNNW